MKALLIVVFLTLSACNHIQTKQQRAEALIKHYLDSTLNDPHSYESVSFSKLYKLKDTIAEFSGKMDTIKYNGWYQIEHTYRAKNGFGGTITNSEWFQIDSAMTKAMCCFREPFSV